MPKYSDIKVQLSGEDGNAFFIIARVTKALRSAGYIGQDEIDTFVAEAMSGDYPHVIATCTDWVTVA